MKIRTIVAAMAAVVWVGGSVAAAQSQTWTGTISDSMCETSHSSMTEHGKKGTDKDCTLMCVKDGAKYVLVSEGEVLQIANQDFQDLERFAGSTVKVTGELKEGAITVTAIEAAPVAG